MKNLMMLLLVIPLSSINLSSQVPFWPVGAKQCIEQACPDFGNTVYYGISLGLNKDTVIQGQYCTLINGDLFFPGPLGEFPHFIRQDSSKIFFYDPEAGNFQLLYDFSLVVGDSYKIKVNQDVFNTDSVTVTIQLKYESMVNGMTVRKQHLWVQADDVGWYISSTPVWEGIGGINGNILLFYNPGILTHCYTKTLWYHTLETGFISVQGPSTQPGGCPMTDTGEELISKWQLDIFPNPASGPITIRYHFAENTIPVKAYLYDSLGRSVADFILEKIQGEIKLENLDAGLYILTLMMEGEIVRAEKIVVVK